MGKKYNFICNMCGYNVESSGKLDVGMMAVVEPYSCNDCNEISDVLVGVYGIKYNKNEIPLGDDELDFYKCTNCNSENIRLWNKKLKPCPKCGSKMKKGQEVIMWD